MTQGANIELVTWRRKAPGEMSLVTVLVLVLKGDTQKSHLMPSVKMRGSSESFMS